MDFSSILSYLQNLLSGKQGQQNQQFGSNLGLEQQQLAQQGSQFDKNLGFQQQQLGQQGNEFNSNLALQKQVQDQANALAQQQFGLSQQGQQFNQGLENRMNVTPGSALWFNMQKYMSPGMGASAPAKSALPLTSQPSVQFIPAGPEWRTS